MTIRNQWSEQNPTGELREWHYANAEKTMVVARVYNCYAYGDGFNVTVRDIEDIRSYKDHLFFVTKNNNYFIAFKANMKLNGD